MPSSARCTRRRCAGAGLGWTAGVGRIGAITGPDHHRRHAVRRQRLSGGFYVFAGIAALAVMTTLIVGHPRDVVDEEVAEHGMIAH